MPAALFGFGLHAGAMSKNGGNQIGRALLLASMLFAFDAVLAQQPRPTWDGNVTKGAPTVPAQGRTPVGAAASGTKSTPAGPVTLLAFGWIAEDGTVRPYGKEGFGRNIVSVERPQPGIYWVKVQPATPIGVCMVQAMGALDIWCQADTALNGGSVGVTCRRRASPNAAPVDASFSIMCFGS